MRNSAALDLAEYYDKWFEKALASKYGGRTFRDEFSKDRRTFYQITAGK